MSSLRATAAVPAGSLFHKFKSLTVSATCTATLAGRGTSSYGRSLHTVVMIRHGESLWNRERRFTGWCDVPLTNQGEADARDAGILMGQRGLKFDVAFTSTLERAWRTCAMSLSASGQSDVETIRSWKLNERHYGALQGHVKNCPRLTQSFGEDMLIDWRRSYKNAPPSLYDKEIFKQIDLDSFRLNMQFMDRRYVNQQAVSDLLSSNGVRGQFIPQLDGSIEHQYKEFPYPSTESLEDCGRRAFGFWKETIVPRVRSGERVLIVAHANTIRALVKELDSISDSMIQHLKIPNGIPLVYTLDDNMEPIRDMPDTDESVGFQAKYLVSARNHQKLMEYERCTRRKLRALFEFLDRDGDGRISRSCLFSGLQELQGYVEDTTSNGSSIVCEYEIEEILRCVPKADELGGVTLDAFLESEKTLLPKLTRLRLLA